MYIRTKICGITRWQDAQLAAALGVDAIGLIFYGGSKRVVDLKQAQTIVSALPPFVSVVALFVNATAEEVRHVLAHVPVHILQFHGDETAAFCRQFNRPYIKAIRVYDAASVDQLKGSYVDARALLLDAAVPQAYGGTGQTFDWSLIPQGLAQPWVLSGGLTPDNIEAALQLPHLQAVDICSGVELSAGVKDARKMKALMQKIRAQGK